MFRGLRTPAVALGLIPWGILGGGSQQPPPPPPPAPPPACQAPISSFGPGSWPPGCWRPYAADTPFNRPIPANPRVASNSGAIVQRLTSEGGPSDLEVGSADTPGDYGRPTYWAGPSDPLYVVHCTESWGTCEIEGMRVRIPGAARPSGGSDRHLTVVDRSDGWEYDFWGVQSKPGGGGRIDTRWGGRTRIDGDGLGSDATAAHFGGFAGIIRGAEMESGGINHALFMVVKCDSGRRVFPAGGLGARCPVATNAPAEGMRFQLAMSNAEIDALSVPAWKKIILRAMARYGMYVGDTGGSPWDIVLESGSTYTSFGYEDAWVRYARQSGIRPSGGRYYLDLASGVPWRRYLRVLDPCVAAGSC